jgi:hypothetical protein
VRVAAARGSKARPELVEIVGAGDYTFPLGGGRAGRFAPLATGTYTLRWRNTSDEDGAVTATVQAKAPRPQNRRLAATFREIPVGTNVVAAAVVPRGGGDLQAPPGALAGVRAEFRTNALRKPTLVALGLRPDLVPPRPARSTEATVAVSVAPANLKLKGGMCTVTLPHGTPPSRYATRLLAFSQKPVSLVVEEMKDATVDAGLRQVSFSPTRLTTFQGFHVIPTEQDPVAVIDLTGPATALALGGDTLFVAFPAADAEAGRVRVFERVGQVWTEGAALTAPAPRAGARFGTAVVYRNGGQGDSVLVSEPLSLQDGDALDGAVHEFVKSGTAWVHRALIRSPDPAGVDLFGRTIAVDGDVLVATAAYEPPSLLPTHRDVFWFRRTADGWAAEAAPAATLDDVLAPPSLSVSGTTLAVGNHDERLRQTDRLLPGALYLSELGGSTWVPAPRLLASASTTGDQFGRAVAAAPGVVAVSCVTGGGAVEVFRASASGWTREKPPVPLVPSGQAPALGESLAMMGPRLAASGWAGGYVWRYGGTRWDLEWILQDRVLPVTGWVYDSGTLVFDGDTAALLSTSRAPGASEPTVRITIFDLPPQ